MRFRLGPLLLAGVLAAAAAGPAAAAAAPRIRAGDLETSANWSGYAVSPLDETQTLRAVSGTWTQPAADCDTTPDASAAFWVGLGGYADASPALEQIGTETDCSDGRARYGVWYELVPAAAVPVKLKLFPGNRLSASVTVRGARVTLKLSNLTRGTSFTKRLRMRSPDTTSAEWVAEAPAGCDGSGRCGVLPLADFGSVTFSRAAATTSAGTAATISDAVFDATPIELTPSAYGPRLGRLGYAVTGAAVPGELSSDGSSFDVTWEAVAP